jgi:hypothetical protein
MATSTEPSFRLKIERAREHIADVRCVIDEWLATDVYTVTSSVDENDSERIVWTASVKADPPTELSLLIGDAVHNLRSALDHAVYYLAGKNLGSLTPQIEAELMFPIFGSLDKSGNPYDARARFQDVAPKCLHGLTLNQVGVIESWQPYLWSVDGFQYHWLWVLHDLDRIDKHRRLAVATALLAMQYVTTPNPDESDTQFFHPGSAAVIDGQKLVAHRDQRDVQAHFERGVAINEGASAGRGAVEVLDQLCGRVAFYTETLTGPTWGQ